MNTKTLSTSASSVIDQYLHFTVGTAVCSIPYFNNKTTRARAALRANIGKGSPRDIFDEVDIILKKNHVQISTLTDESLKKLLVDNAIGIDCSAFIYYILNAESEFMGKGTIDKHISFINCHGIIGRIRCALRPVENCGVATFADDKNSTVVPLHELQPSDLITMLGGPDTNDRDHILVIHQIEYKNSAPFKIHYSHAIMNQEDGIYGSGVKQGIIEILDPTKPITDARWTENDKFGADNRIYIRVQKSKTELRRVRGL